MLSTERCIGRRRFDQTGNTLIFTVCAVLIAMWLAKIVRDDVMITGLLGRP